MTILLGLLFHTMGAQIVYIDDSDGGLLKPLYEIADESYTICFPITKNGK